MTEPQAHHRQRRQPVTRRRHIADKLARLHPDRHYHFVARDRVQDRAEDYNYRIERGEGAKVTNPRSLEGAITSGKDVLMSCPRAEWEAREAERREDAKTELAGPREGFKMKAMRDGVEAIDQTKSKVGNMASVVGGAKQDLEEPK